MSATTQTATETYFVAAMNDAGDVVSMLTGPIEGMKPARGEFRSAKRILQSDGYAENVTEIRLIDKARNVLATTREEVSDVTNETSAIAELDAPEDVAAAVIEEPEAVVSAVDLSAFNNWQIDTAEKKYLASVATELERTGAYPRRYRAYRQEEWTAIYDALAAAIDRLEPEDQAGIGVYIEERGDTFLLVRAKLWQLLIDVPAKASKSGKTLKITPVKAYTPVERYYYDNRDDVDAEKKAINDFVDFAWTHLQGESRDLIFDVLAQYHPAIRFTINLRVRELSRPRDITPFLPGGAES